MCTADPTITVWSKRGSRAFFLRTPGLLTLFVKDNVCHERH